MNVGSREDLKKYAFRKGYPQHKKETQKHADGNYSLEWDI